jgi:predicted nucleic acid-binding protein
MVKDWQSGRDLQCVGRWKIHAPDLSYRLDELRATLHKPRVAELVKPYKAGRLVNQIKKLAADVDPLPPVIRSPDPTDDFLLAMSEAGKADYLVTGDKGGLLARDCHKATRIISASDFAALFA